MTVPATTFPETAESMQYCGLLTMIHAPVNPE